MTDIAYRTADVDGLEVFYREAGSADAPTLLLLHGFPDTTRVSPDGYGLDNFYLARPGADQIQLDLMLDYASNVALYPAWHEYFRASAPPLLAVWGSNDPFFLPAGAEAFKRDLPEADIRFVPTGHFALETHVEEIARAIIDFLGP